MFKTQYGDVFDMIRDKKVILFGCGERTVRFLNIFRYNNIEIIGAYDNNNKKLGTQYYGIPYISWDKLCKYAKYEDTVILICSHYAEITKQLIKSSMYIFFQLKT